MTHTQSSWLECYNRNISTLCQALEQVMDNCSDRGNILGLLSSIHLVYYRETAASASLDNALRLCHDALNFRQLGNEDKDISLNTLSLILLEFYRRTHDPTFLTNAIKNARDTLELRSPEQPQYIETLNTLALLLRDWSRHNHHDNESLEEAVQISQAALDKCPPGHPFRDLCLDTLAIVLDERWTHGSDADALTRTISLRREVLTLRHAEHPLQTRTLYNLVLSLTQQYKKSTSPEILYEYVSLNREALRLCPPGHAIYPDLLVLLANSLRDEYMRNENTAIIEESEALRKKAVDFLAPDHPHYPGIIAGSSLALYEQFERTGSLALLDEAIVLLQKGVSELGLWYANRHILLGNLCAMLHSRYDCLGDLASLEATASTCQQALDLRPPGHPYRVYSLYEHALTLRAQYFRTKNSLLLLEAQSSLQDAMETGSAGHSMRGDILYTLAVNFCDYYEVNGDFGSLDQAIHLFRMALEGNLLGDPAHKKVFWKLGDALYHKYKRSRILASFEEAIRLLHDASALYYVGNPERHGVLSSLATIYTDLESPRFDILRALGYLLEIVGDAQAQPRSRLVEARKLLRAISDAHKIGPPHVEDAAKICDTIIRAYQETISLLPLVANFSLDLLSRLRELALSQSLGSEGATFAMEHGRGAVAFEILEDSRAVFWSQALRLRDTKFESLPSPFSEQLNELFEALARPPHSGSTESQDKDAASRRRQSESVQRILDDVRKISGYDRFLLGQPFSTLARAASKGPVAFLTANGHGCNALILLNSNGDWRHVHLSGLTTDSLRNLVVQTRGLGTRRGERDDVSEPDGEERAIIIQHRDRQNSLTALPVLRELWYKVVIPIFLRLGLKKATGRDRPRLYWCPTGEFAFVPLHAAGIYQGSEQVNCSDFVVSSYSPTLSALMNARDGWALQTKEKLTALVVAEGIAPGFAEIPHVQREVQTVLDVFATSSNIHINSEGADPSVGAQVRPVMEQLEKANIVHLACHGQQSPGDPLESGFRLRDGPLTVSTLMRLRLPNALFAFLSACETAQGDQEHPDQTMHLAAAMLFTGFKSVVATMWPMRDEDGPTVAQAFYQELLGGDVLDEDAVAYALDVAVTKLRTSGQVALHRWAPFIHIGA